MSDESIEIEYPEPEYALYEANREGLPAVVVVNRALKEFPHSDIFPWHLSVIIIPHVLADNGMPAPEEGVVLAAVGDEIEQAVVADENALFLARETWNGMRDLVFLVHDAEKANETLQAMVNRPDPQRDWEFRMDHDPSWSFAEPFLMLLNSPAS
jgi:hypothetical protein